MPESSPAPNPQPSRVFISYAHDRHRDLAARVSQDLQSASHGHNTWFDDRELTTGIDWERAIEDGLDWAAVSGNRGYLLLLMTPHAVRRPNGYCLNELARAIERKLTIVPVMVETCEPPLSICRIQWLDMRDCVPLEESEERYATKFGRLVEALEKGRLEFDGAQSRLASRLKPVSFEEEIRSHLPRFKGRAWLLKDVDDWLQRPNAKRVFWLTGGPGTGKTAFSAWLAHVRPEIAAVHFCRYQSRRIRASASRCLLSIAYQLASQIPDYFDRLNALALEDATEETSAQDLFDELLVEDLRGYRSPDRPPPLY